MNKIYCYKRGCNNLARWTIPGHPTTHLCNDCFLELFPDKNIQVQRVQQPVGPSELKEDEDVTEDSE